ncbi:Uncharacterized protein FWK35_00036545 [Aphis craccivora]|uniref:Uncharacterized protein n=1 Tax=Aphis craccivora TaxID=307492 RepID=A0A6G0Y8F8_APHCR|nr:Uncharacterized protein FWK35_00036545 [Aphis craccivora]
MIMRIVITTTAVCLAISSLATATAEQANLQQSAEISETNLHQQNVDPDEARINVNVTAIAARLINDYVTPTICSVSPEFCAKHQLQSRGIQSYLATAGTLLAGVLGVIMTKISLLIALSLLSTVIGKMLLFYALFKTGPPHPYYKAAHHHAQPFVKYTKDKYYIKNTPSVHNHDVIVDSPPEHSSPYHAYSPSILDSSVHDHKLKGVSYYKR